MNRHVAIVTGWGGNLGTGHMQRMATLAAHLVSKGIPCSICAPEPPLVFPPTLKALFTNDIPPDTTLIIRDKRDSSIDEMAFLKRIAPVITLDDCGNGRNEADRAIDLLPNLIYPHDPEGPRLYGYAFCESIRQLAGARIRKDIDLAVYCGLPPDERMLSLVRTVIPDSCRSVLLAGNDIMPLAAINGASEHLTPPSALCMSKVLLTYFGITLYEGVCAGCRGITINPTPYHSRLADIAQPETGAVNLGHINQIDIENSRTTILAALEHSSLESIDASDIAMRIEDGLHRMYRILHEYL